MVSYIAIILETFIGLLHSFCYNWALMPRSILAQKVVSNILVLMAADNELGKRAWEDEPV